MSLTRTEILDEFTTEADAVAAIRRLMKQYEWDQLFNEL